MAFFTTKSGSIVASVIIAAALVGGAYYLSTPHTPEVNAASDDQALKAYAALDSDGDGLPDWEEALYGTDPHNPDTFDLGMTDEQAVEQGLIKLKVETPAAVAAEASSTATTTSLASTVPGAPPAPTSMTAQFAEAFFDNYISSRGSTPPTADQLNTFIQGAIQNLEQTQARPEAYAASDITVSGSGASALTSFAASADAAFAQYGVQTPYDEMTYFQDATEKDDASAVANLQAISGAYINTAKAIAALPVPSEAASADLDLVNSMAQLGATIGDLASVQTDPVRAMLGLQNYPGDLAAATQALQTWNALFASEGISFSPGQQGYSFYYLTEIAVADVSSP